MIHDARKTGKNTHFEKQKKPKTMNRKPHIAVVGAANIDLTAMPHTKYIPQDSCPGSIAISYGGVGRNIAHNLVLMGCEVSLVTVFGEDEFAAQLKRDCKRLGMDIQQAATIPGAKSSMYVCVNNEKGELMSAVAAMDITQCLTPEFLSTRIDMLNACDAVVFDANLTTESVAYLLDNCKVPLFADTVSATKSHNIFNALDGMRSLHTLKLNRLEAQELFVTQDPDITDFEAVANLLHQKGVKRIFITLGAKGCYYHDAEGGRQLPCENVPVVNTSGAGDAFLSGAIFAYFKGLDTESTLKCALRAAAFTVQHLEAVNPEMNEKYVLNE